MPDDASARRRAEAALRASEEQARASEEKARAQAEELAALLESAPAIIWIARDPDCRVITGSRHGHELLRMPMAANLSKTAAEVDPLPHFRVYADGMELPPDRLPMQRAARGEEVLGYEEQIVFDNGDTRYLFGNAVPLRNPDGSVRGAIGAFVDITDRREALAALRESEERLRLAMAAASVGVWSWDLHSGGVFWSPECREIFGVKQFDGTIDEVRAALHPEDRAHTWAWTRRVLRGHPVLSAEFRIRRPDGEVRWVLSHGCVVRDARHHPVRMLGAVRDVTEQRRNEAALREADRRKDEFLAMLAHELRNPLAPIRNAAHLLRRLPPGDPRVAEVHDVIERQTDQLTRLVDDLLDVSRINRGRITLRREPVELAQVITRAVETSRPLIDNGRHRLTVSLPADPVHLHGDLARLTQVFSNLLNNSARYTEPGGEISLQAERSGGEILLRVRDNGIGIAQDVLPHVFDLFTQGNRALDRPQGGLGIGLTLVRSIVELHGGRVAAHSDGRGLGSEFTVRLPCLAQAFTHASPALRPADIGTRTARILVVDDNSDSASSISLLLKLAGHAVETAFDGPQALDTARAFSPDVVLLDIGMPAMNGYEVARRLRRNCSPQPCLIAMTGYSQTADAHRARDAGFDHYLTKPVDPDVLASLIGSMLTS